MAVAVPSRNTASTPAAGQRQRSEGSPYGVRITFRCASSAPKTGPSAAADDRVHQCSGNVFNWSSSRIATPIRGPGPLLPARHRQRGSQFCATRPATAASGLGALARLLACPVWRRTRRHEGSCRPAPATGFASRPSIQRTPAARWLTTSRLCSSASTDRPAAAPARRHSPATARPRLRSAQHRGRRSGAPGRAPSIRRRGGSRAHR